MKITSAIVLAVCGIAAGAHGQLFSPAITNPGFEDDDLSPGAKTASISGWYNRTSYCWAAEEGNADFPQTPYGANWCEFGNLSWVYQQIGTWEPGIELRVGLLVGSVNGTDFPGVRVSLWAGGDPAQAADANPSLPSTTLDTAVGATQIAISDVIKPAALYSDTMGSYEFLGTGQASEESVILSTGSGQTSGEPLWLLIQAAGRKRSLVDNISVMYLSGDPMVVNPTPGDYAEDVDPAAAMRWEAFNVTSPTFNLHIGTTTACDDVLASNTGAAMTYTLPAGILHYAKTWYWRVDITDEGSTYPGPVWRFTTGGKAGGPVPQDGGTADRSVGALSWAADPLAASYDVYFGHPGDLRFVDNYTAANVSFADLAATLSKGVLPPDQYQWRVDTRNAAGELMVTGDIWNVTIPDVQPIILEDFHAYNDTAAMLTEWSGADGATPTLDDIYGSMRLDYDNRTNPWKSQATLTFDSPQDWAHTGLETIVFSLRGVETNAAETISLTVSDGTNAGTMTHPQPPAAMSPRWQTWHVRLSDFVEAGVDLRNIAAVTIAVGDGTAPGQTGTLYLDDLSLLTVGCIDAFQPAGDLNADCQITLADVVILADNWLIADFEIAGAAPDAGRLLAYYAFDEQSGSTAADSSGQGHNATVDANDLAAVWDDSGHSAGCLQIDPSTTVTLPAAVFTNVSDQLTISMWINGQPADFPSKVNQASFAAGPASEAQNDWDDVAWILDSADDYGGRWNHYAAVKDAPTGMMRLYCNGVLVAQTTNANQAIAGDAQDTLLKLAGFDAATTPTVKIDELRIYAYALSHAEIAYLAADGTTPVMQPVEPIYTSCDVNDDGAVNLPDFAIIAAAWMSD